MQDYDVDSTFVDKETGLPMDFTEVSWTAGALPFSCLRESQRAPEQTNEMVVFWQRKKRMLRGEDQRC